MNIKKITENPYLNMGVGIIFLWSGISETLSELQELEEFKMGAHHGVIIFSIMHILKTLPDIFEGLEYLSKEGEE
ncbi:MAG: hypothetical protein OSB05_09880 [Akkermansiaceae bacterium]|nr:hypothetical protein [Akkermansiaceae bacterium]